MQINKVNSENSYNEYFGSEYVSEFSISKKD